MKIHLYGHVLAPTGYGRACRELAHCLLAGGHELEIFPLESGPTPDVPLATMLRRHKEGTLRPDVTIVHTLPMDCVTVLEKLDPPEYRAAIAYTTWEGLSEAPPSVIARLFRFRQIWTPSRASAKGFDKGIETFVIPHSYDTQENPATYVSMGSPSVFKFYYVGAWSSRKNPQGILRAFARAFTREHAVELNLQCSGAPQEAYAIALHMTGVPVSEMPKIRFHGTPMTDAQVGQIHTSMDCYVSAARGEAWNLPAFDAMLAGRNIIATGGLGSDDFLMDTSATLVGGMAQPALVDVMQVGRTETEIHMKAMGAQGLTCKSTWLEPDLVRLAQAMRDAALTKRRDLHRKYSPAERYSRDAVGKLCTHALEALHL